MGALLGEGIVHFGSQAAPTPSKRDVSFAPRKPTFVGASTPTFSCTSIDSAIAPTDAKSPRIVRVRAHSYASVTILLALAVVL